MSKTVTQTPDSSQLRIDQPGQAPGFVQVVALIDPATGDPAGTQNTTAFIDTYFDALHAFTGASVGDLIVQTDVYDMTTNPPTLTETTWRNATTGLALGSAPSGANLTYKGGAGLTDAQLRATPVPVVDAALGAQLPAALGSQAAADSLGVALSTEDVTTQEAILTSLQAIQAQTAGWSAANYSTAGNKLVKTGAGTLHIVNVNSLGTIASSIVVYDGTDATGTKLATIDSLNDAGPNQYDIDCAVGIFLVITGTVAPDVTVSFR